MLEQVRYLVVLLQNLEDTELSKPQIITTAVERVSVLLQHCTINNYTVKHIYTVCTHQTNPQCKERQTSLRWFLVVEELRERQRLMASGSSGVFQMPVLPHIEEILEARGASAHR